MRQFIYFLKRPLHFIKTGLIKGTWGQIKYRFPAKKINTIVITGTDGKTTTSNLVYHILNSNNKKTGLISTVAAKIGKKELDTGLHVTAPEPIQLNQFLREMVDEKCQFAVVEMTSHGAYQFRDWGIKPIIAGLTNVTHEHLDYHPDYDHYIDAKCLLLKKAPVVIINEDDRSFYKVRQRLELKKQEVESFSLEEKISTSINQAIKKRFPEPYNHSNARLAVKIVQQLGLTDKEIASAINTFPGVSGRMEEIDLGQKFRVVVDFAHTPNAIEKALAALKLQQNKQKKKGRLIALFGSAGKRDISKRPIMGQAAVKNADIVIITADDPRSEDVWSIIHQIKSGVEQDQQKIVSITDRYQAINFALTQLAQPGDIVALLGKGAEKSLAIGKREIPWSDQKVAEQIIKESILNQ
jgi:UDP-N-acetylmuramoyl-L-alanyl-D-glutamate--2,6-diaminopimelate ligase